ncbi:MAG: nucleotidyltransferase domain-containing protein [Bacillota bacterium]|nr:nucleotidyltransferase domain-containing protein [Bacillota bacterium]
MIEEIRKNHLVIEQKKKQNIEVRRNTALKAAEDIAKMLKEKYCVLSVVLYGSLVGGKFDSYSDIDLYVEGLGEDYFTALHEAQMIAGDIEVSIACSTDVLESLRENIQQNGVKLG